jgi:hypothetical protein
VFWQGAKRQDWYGREQFGGQRRGQQRTGRREQQEIEMSTITHASRAELIRQEIMSLADEHGIVTPRVVFEAAKNPNSALHGEFVWDGKQAIEDLGLQRAAALIRTVRVQVVIDSRKVVAPYFVNDPRDSRPGEYLPLQSVKNDDELRHGVLLAEISRIEGAVMRAKAIAGVVDLSAEFEQMMTTVGAIKERVKAA